MNRISSRGAAVTAGALAMLFVISLNASAQDVTPPRTPPAHIAWQLTVLENGQEVDHLSATTAVGQSRTITRQRAMSRPVGCNGAQTQPVDLTRTVTVSPLGVDAHGMIGFDVTAEEAVVSAENDTVRSDGCTLPPPPRIVNAHHPELDVQSGQSATWTLLKKDPELVYRLEATVTPASPDD